MKNSGEFTITDHLFHQTISCPLKLSFILKKNNTWFGASNLRQRNKLELRNAIARTYPNPKFTDDDSDTAYLQTKDWLENNSVVSICGAVLKTDHFLTRIPVLFKKGEQIQIIQVHGKLVRSHRSGIFENDRLSRSASGYLLKAAYRKEIARHSLEGYTITTHFIFPVKNFRSVEENMFKAALKEKNLSKDTVTELNNLFTKIEATGFTDSLSDCLPDSHTYTTFTGLSVMEAMEKVKHMILSDEVVKPPDIHSTCKYCEFRRSADENGNGCWSQNFSDQLIEKPELHLFELVGPGEAADLSLNNYFRENGTQPAGFETPEKVTQANYPKISIQQRRALQLLEAKDKNVPLVWIKSYMDKLLSLRFPLHFIDFEAATHPIPMEKGRGPYDPVLFQFSCHTLYEDGSLVHSEWLDTDTDSHPHKKLTDALLKIPDFEEGTIVQYSPFERQSIFRLMHESSGDKTDGITDNRDKFKNILKYGTKLEGSRFFDLNKELRDGYYNRFMHEGLSLKQIFKSVIQTEKLLKIQSYRPIKDQIKNDGIDKPYELNSDSDIAVIDGESAMNAYLALKSGAVTETEQTVYPELLKHYCKIDSYALFVIYKHITTLLSTKDSDGDLIISNDFVSHKN